MMLPHVAARVFGVPLMVCPQKAAAIVGGLGGRILGSVVEVDGAEPLFHSGGVVMGKLGDRMGRAFDRVGVAPFDRVENVAVIPIEGTLVHKGEYVGKSSGQTSYQGLQTQITRAARNDDIKGVVFEVDSFGGEVSGAFETVKMIAQLSAVKPTIAILTDNALSAGYLMASAARQIVMPEFGRAGSIGVVTMHINYQRKLEQDGIKVTVLSAGKHKADGNPFEALPEPLASRIRGEIEQGRQRFAETVGLYRGRRFSMADALATEAQDYRSEDAVKLGLVDAVGDVHEAFSAFIAAVNKR